MTNRINIYDQAGLDRLRRELRLDPGAMRRLRNDLFKRFHADETALSRFPAPEQLKIHAVDIFQQYDSSLDGATKLLFRTEAGRLIESVILRIATGRTTLCLSSQVGCAAACEFCATGKMGIAQNLAVEEILDQVLQAGQILAKEGRRLRNLVFMGMGEPFHNEENIYAVLEKLTAPEWFHHSPTKILLSTVGIPEAMVRCARRFPSVNQALSLHAVRPEIRERLIPLAKKYPLSALRHAVSEVNRLQRAGRKSEPTVMIEYLMLAGVNDSKRDAHELAEWCRGLSVHVNLIPYNAIDDAPQLNATTQAQREAFANILKQVGLATTIRYSLGADIAAACGQLVRKENRRLVSAGMEST